MVRDEQVSRLNRLKGEFLKAHGDDKKRLRTEIDSLRGEISDWTHPNGEVSSFDWQVEFAEVFAGDDGDSQGGFDAILANPPYVRQELIKSLKPALKNIFPEVYTGISDLYVYFYARALQLLHPGGMLTVISSNKWFRANYGAKLRKHVADTTHVSSITDFGDLHVFRNASAYPMIFIARKDHDTTATTTLTQPKTLNPPYPDVAAVVRKIGNQLPPEALNGTEWSLTDAATAARLRKMRAAGVPLGEYVKGQIYRGVLTGFNKAFVIDGPRREELIAKDPKSAEIIKPFATGRDVRKWVAEYKDKWLIFTRRGISINKYPASEEYLSQWQAELTPKKTSSDEVGRKPGPYKWYEIQDSVAYYKDFEGPKIVWGNLGLEPRFAYHSQPLYINAPANLIPTDDLYLLGILNSSTSRRFFEDISIQRSDTYLVFSMAGFRGAVKPGLIWIVAACYLDNAVRVGSRARTFRSTWSVSAISASRHRLIFW